MHTPSFLADVTKRGKKEGALQPKGQGPVPISSESQIRSHSLLVGHSPTSRRLLVSYSSYPVALRRVDLLPTQQLSVDGSNTCGPWVVGA